VTEPGQRLRGRLGPALGSIGTALLEAPPDARRSHPPDRTADRPVNLLSPKLAAFTRTYPDIVLDITSEDDTRADLVAGRYDAGIHLGEFLQRDMTAVRVTREQRAAVVAAPGYFDTHPKPKTPHDIMAHRCLQYRIGTDGPVPRWEFEKRGKAVTVSAAGPVIVSDAQFMIRAALDAVGLAYASRTTSPSTSREEISSGCWRTGARRSRGTFSTIRVVGTNGRRCFVGALRV
jgi:DNA-binding transcriptional LysR family regulator